MAKSTAIGIDLGTTYSCAAYWDKNKERVEIIPNGEGQNTTPSVVAFTQPKGKMKGERLVGLSAQVQAAKNSTNTIYDVKRLIGRSYYDQTVRDDMKIWPFTIAEGVGGRPMVCAKYQGEMK